jgi:hypothetical protein
LSTKGAVAPGQFGTQGFPVDLTTRGVMKRRFRRESVGRSPWAVPLPFQSVPVSGTVRLRASTTPYTVPHLSPLVVHQRFLGL